MQIFGQIENIDEKLFDKIDKNLQIFINFIKNFLKYLLDFSENLHNGVFYEVISL